MSGCNSRTSHVYSVELYLQVFLSLKILQFNFFRCVTHTVAMSGMQPLSWLGLHVVFYRAGTNCKALSLD